MQVRGNGDAGGAERGRGVLQGVHDARALKVAERQFGRISRTQLLAAGMSTNAITHRVRTGRLVIVDCGVFAFAPVLAHDPWGRWMAATLSHPGNVLCRLSATVARGILSLEGPLVTVTRDGSGGPRRLGNAIVHRCDLPDGDVTTLRGIPITTVPRTLVDIAPLVSGKALARAVREAVRLGQLTLPELGDALGRYRGRRGIRALAETVARYSGLPLERARSGAEVVAMELLQGAATPLPRLNVDVAGEEADLSWPAWRLIIEIDGGPFHRDRGEDARKEAVWRGAGWEVRRLPSDDVYERPWRLLECAAPPNVHLDHA